MDILSCLAILSSGMVALFLLRHSLITTWQHWTIVFCCYLCLHSALRNSNFNFVSVSLRDCGRSWISIPPLCSIQNPSQNFNLSKLSLSITFSNFIPVLSSNGLACLECNLCSSLAGGCYDEFSRGFQRQFCWSSFMNIMFHSIIY